VRRFTVGAEAEGLFTLFGIVFFFIGLALFGIGLLGEYVGRIYAQVRERPRYIVEAVLEQDADANRAMPGLGSGRRVTDHSIL
jgi:undecaprenyl-phosphate 4-deoxy-4-formamido-L-arabinose transferase